MGIKRGEDVSIAADMEGNMDVLAHPHLLRAWRTLTDCLNTCPSTVWSSVRDAGLHRFPVRSKDI